jgi:ParB/Sulfiredoxin domain
MAQSLADAIKARTQPKAYSIGVNSQELATASVRTDGGTQARAELNQETAAEYAQAMQEGAQFPPIVVYYDGETYWLADGFHRVEAARRTGRAVLAEIRPGTRRDAVLAAVGANDQHGLRRTRADVQRAIKTLLRDAEWQHWSDREIARQVRCSDKTVGAARARLSAEIPHIDQRTVERSGTTYQQTVRPPVGSIAPPERRGVLQRPSPPAPSATNRAADERAEAAGEAQIAEVRAAAIAAARAFSTQQRALVSQWSAHTLARQADFKAALAHIDALLALLEGGMT